MVLGLPKCIGDGKIQSTLFVPLLILLSFPIPSPPHPILLFLSFHSSRFLSPPPPLSTRPDFPPLCLFYSSFYFILLLLCLLPIFFLFLPLLSPPLSALSIHFYLSSSCAFGTFLWQKRTLRDSWRIQKLHRILPPVSPCYDVTRNTYILIKTIICLGYERDINAVWWNFGTNKESRKTVGPNDHTCNSVSRNVSGITLPEWRRFSNRLPLFILLISVIHIRISYIELYFCLLLFCMGAKLGLWH